jgi:hypothetical protein
VKPPDKLFDDGPPLGIHPKLMCCGVISTTAKGKVSKTKGRYWTAYRYFATKSVTRPIRWFWKRGSPVGPPRKYIYASIQDAEAAGNYDPGVRQYQRVKGNQFIFEVLAAADKANSHG